MVATDYHYKLQLSALRKIVLDGNVKWCPDEKIRLNMHLEKHFFDRMLERFTPERGAALFKEVLQWIDSNYCMVLFDNALTGSHQYRIKLENGTAAFVLFDGTLRIRTCFIPPGADNEPEQRLD